MMKRSLSTLCLALIISAPAYCGEDTASTLGPVVNVVLVEVGGASLAEPMVVGDKEYWNRRAPALLGALEQLGHVPAGEARSVYLVRSSAQTLEEASRSSPLIAYLDSLCGATKRLSLIIVWCPREGQVYLAYSNLADLKAADSLAFLAHYAPVSNQPHLLARATLGYVSPPCLLAMRPPGEPPTTEGLLDFDLSSEEGQARLLHVLQTLKLRLVEDGTMLELLRSSPAGTQVNVMQLANGARATALASVPLLSASPIRPIAWTARSLPLFDKVTTTAFDRMFQFTNSIQQRKDYSMLQIANVAHGSKWTLPSFEKMYGPPKGILFEPALNVVVDSSGVSKATVEAVVSAVQGKSGAEVNIGGEKVIAATWPGTEELFRVTVGGFHCSAVDLSVPAGNDSLQLVRFYDSRRVSPTPLGPGWVNLPFALEIGPETIRKGDNVVPRDLVLRDHRVGASLKYRAELAEGDADGEEPPGVLVSYKQLSTSFQPELVARASGEFLCVFGDGRQIAFDRNGKLIWSASRTGERTVFSYAGNELRELRLGNESIILAYNDGKLTSAEGSNGRKVSYDYGSMGRLTLVKGAYSAAETTFDYDARGRLTSAQTLAKGGGQIKTGFSNTFDSQGRLLTTQDTRGTTTFEYDDTIGQVKSTDSNGKTTTWLFDGSGRLAAFGSARNSMTVLNHDLSGRLLQVAIGELVNEPGKGQRPSFKFGDLVIPRL